MKATAIKPAVAPILVSDETAPALVGMTPRQFRAFVRLHGVPRMRFKRRTFATAADVVAALHRQGGEAPRQTLTEEEVIARAAGRR